MRQNMEHGFLDIRQASLRNANRHLWRSVKYYTESHRGAQRTSEKRLIMNNTNQHEWLNE
jgi:hypothetical protein